MENKDTKKSYEEMINTYFGKNPIYNSSEKKACFILGVLIKNVVNKQKKELNGNTPFLNRVKAFNLSGVEDIKKLVAETSGKLIEYRIRFDSIVRTFKKNFEESKVWNLSNIDSNFYILLGYVSYWELFNQEKEEEETFEEVEENE